MKKQIIYLDVFSIYNFDFMYWYISTDGETYVMQSLNIGENQCNDFYSILGIQRNNLKIEYDEKLGEIWTYETNYKNPTMVNQTYKIRMYDCTYNDFMNIMSIYNQGKIFCLQKNAN